MIDALRSFAWCFAKILNFFQTFDFSDKNNFSLYSSIDDHFILIHNLKLILSPMKSLGFFVLFSKILAILSYALKRNTRIGRHRRRFANVSQVLLALSRMSFFITEFNPIFSSRHRWGAYGKEIHGY